jgi:hypothetical protein
VSVWEEAGGLLGMTITKGTVQVSEDKVSAIKDEKALTSKKDVRHFLGMTNYHWWFIQNYSKIVHPLHDLTKDILFKWTERQDQSFSNLKEALTVQLVLALPKDYSQFRLENDASDVVKVWCSPRNRKTELTNL